MNAGKLETLSGQMFLATNPLLGDIFFSSACPVVCITWNENLQQSNVNKSRSCAHRHGGIYGNSSIKTNKVFYGLDDSFLNTPRKFRGSIMISF